MTEKPERILQDYAPLKIVVRTYGHEREIAFERGLVRRTENFPARLYSAILRADEKNREARLRERPMADNGIKPDAIIVDDLK